MLLIAYALVPTAMRVLRGDVGLGLQYARHAKRRHRLIEVEERELHEQAMPDIRPHQARPLWLLYPVHGLPRATLLGNVRAAVADRVESRYGLKLNVGWPRISAMLDASERESVDAARKREDRLTATAAGWTMACLASALMAVLYVGGSPVVVLTTLASVFLARSTYDSAVGAAMDHGRQIESSVDLHRIELLDQMGYRRPVDTRDEREIFTRLSVLLEQSGGVPLEYAALVGDPVTNELVTHLNAALDDAILGLDDRLGAELRGTVSDAVDRSLEERVRPEVIRTVGNSISLGMAETVAPTLGRQVTDLLRGPRLVNYLGAVSAGIYAGEQRLAPGADGSVVLNPGEEHRLAVSVGPEATETAASATLRITGGEDAPSVRFGVVVDSDAKAWRMPEESVKLATRGESRQVEFRLPPRDLDDTGWLWIRLIQNGRTIQNLELSVAPEG